MQDCYYTMTFLYDIHTFIIVIILAYWVVLINV